MKKLISTGLVFFIVLALSVSAFATIPRNDLAGSANLSYIQVVDEDSNTHLVQPNMNFPFGSFNYCSLDIERQGGSRLSNVAPLVTVPIIVEQTGLATIYIAVSPLIDYFNFSSESLSEYRYSDGDITVSFPAGTYNSFSGTWPLLTPSNFSLTSSDFSYNNSVSVDFICFKDVPGDGTTYLFSFEASGSYGSASPWVFPIGVYISISYGLIKDFEDGRISFDDTINELISQLDEILNDDSLSDSEKLVSISVIQVQLEIIKQISDIKYNTVVSNFVEETESIIDDFVSGSIDVYEAIDDMQIEYFDALSQCVTPEQGTYINTSYQIQMDKLHLLWMIDFQNNLDEVISDEDLENKDIANSQLQEYIDNENTVIELFEEAEISSYLEFGSYLENLKGNDINGIKSIYNFFLTKDESSVYFNFVTIPFTLVVFALVLSTSLVVFRGGKDG